MTEPSQSLVGLKACPFCQKDAFIERGESDGRRGISVECGTDSCFGFLTSYDYDTEAEAIAAWNTRAPDPRDATIALQDKRIAELEGEGWRSIETAPYSVPVKVKLGHGMEIVARLIPNASMTTEETSCDQWQAEYEGEHPDCWSEGACWESNADMITSMQPEGWMPLPSPPAASGESGG